MGIANHFTFAAFNVLTPYPSTPFYERLKPKDDYFTTALVAPPRLPL